jgi:sugar-specific transcriptional regulator TrmB
MSGISRLSEPKVAQEIREIFERHKERISNISPVISIIESLVEHFDTFIRREIDDIRKQLDILDPWFPISDEKKELNNLENNFETVSSKLLSLLTDVKQGKITDLKSVDLNIIMSAFKIIDDVEKLWNKTQKWSLSLLKQAELFRQWLEEILPKEE